MTGGEGPSAAAWAPATRHNDALSEQRDDDRDLGAGRRDGHRLSPSHTGLTPENFREVFGSIPEPTCNQTVHIAFSADPTAMALTGDMAPPGARAWTLDSKDIEMVCMYYAY
jgi:hypothetical protein